MDPIEPQDCFWFYLSRPVTLVKLVKQYHSIDSRFVLLTLVQVFVLLYLSFKSLLHLCASKQVSIYYSDKYWPCVFESYPHPEDFVAAALFFNLWCLFSRLKSNKDLIKDSIKHRNGYKHIKTTQLNLSMLTHMSWPLRDWIRFIPDALKHKKLCLTGGKTRKIHLYLDKEFIDEHLNKLGRNESGLSANLIDFTGCYEHIGLFGNQSDWFKVYHTARPIFRLDLTECAFLMIMTIFGLPFLLSSLSLVLVLAIWFEISKAHEDSLSMARNDSRWQLADLLLDPNRLLRLFDLLWMIVSQLPHHLEAFAVYFDLASMVSRTRKIGATHQIGKRNQN